MKVFLSHSTRDKDFVEKLAAAMTASGFKPWLCEVDIEKGANFVAEINEGLAQSDIALLVWSPDAAKSAWTEQEWTSLLARQVEEQRIRLGIIRLRDCDLPELLRTSNWIEARSNKESGIHDTVEWLKRRQSAQRLSGLKAPVILEAYPKDDLFVGRGSYLKQLRTVFSEGPARFLLHGEPGAGKSTLAMRFAWEAQKDFDAVVFQRCGLRSVGEIVGELAYKLRGQLGEQVLQLPPEKKLEAAAEWLRARQSLLVLDDVWTAEVKQIEPGGACSVLHTSRQQSLPWISAGHTSEVVSFSNVECQSLFHASLDKDFGADEVTQHSETLLGFAAQVERLPIAVAVGASLLRQKKASGLHRGTLRLCLDELSDGVQDVPGLFRTAIESQPEREQRLLAACGMCVQENLWLPLAAEITELSEDDAEDAADRLVHSSLLRVLDRERRRFQLHALLRDQLRAQESADALAKLQERHVAALEGLFKDRETRWRECRECLDEIVPAADFLGARGEYDRAWQMSYSGYETGRRIGELDVALRIMQQAGKVAAERGDHDTMQRSYGNQAFILQAWGLLDEAMALFKKQEAICLESGTKKGLSSSYGGQGMILRDWGRLEEALALHKKQEAICLELGNKDGLQATYNNQAVILRAWGRLDEALALHKKTEAICRELGNKDGLAASYCNQAGILRAWGRLEEALALHKKTEAVCLELGNTYLLQASYNNQAGILRTWGRLEEALALLKKQEAICQELGTKDNLAVSYGDQGNILRAWGRLEEALGLFKKQEAICLELGTKDGLSRSYGNQALILAAWGRLAEALALLKKAEGICLESGDKYALQASYNEQALILQAWGRLEEALALLKKQEAICLELGSKDGLQASYGNQGTILEAWGRLEEALALYQKQEAIGLELGDRDGLQRSYGNQGNILSAWGRLEEALALLKKQEAICLELGERNSLQNSYGGQALILRTWGRLEEALALLKVQEAICLELSNKNALGYCYLNWGQLARAQGDRKTEIEKLEQALALFIELKMPRERDAVLAELGAPHPNRMFELKIPGEHDAALTPIGGPSRHSAPIAVSPQASTPHPAADPERAYRLNLAYQEEKARWMALPKWKQRITKKPDPPKGI